jgi:hypothetical protein
MQNVIPRIADIDFDSPAPADANEPANLSVHVEIGPADGPGVDLFTLSVCNPAHLGEKNAAGRWSWRRQMLVTESLTADTVRLAISERIAALGPFQSWPDFAARLSPYVRWEFEGMPYPPFPV